MPERTPFILLKYILKDNLFNSKSIALNKEKWVKQEQIYTETVLAVFTLKSESQYIFGPTISPR